MAVLVAAGFVAGVMFTMSCGVGGGNGNGNGSAMAMGSMVEHHVTSLPDVQVFFGATVIDRTFTPADPSDVVLRVIVRGESSTSASDWDLTLRVLNGAGTYVHAVLSSTVPVAMNRPFRIATSLETLDFSLGPGSPDGQYRIFMDAINPSMETIDFSSLVVELITLKGVTVLNPSPLL